MSLSRLLSGFKFGAPCSSCRTRGAPTRCRDGMIQSGFGLLSDLRNVRTVWLRDPGAISATQTRPSGTTADTGAGFAPRDPVGSQHLKASAASAWISVWARCTRRLLRGGCLWVPETRPWSLTCRYAGRR